MRITLTQKSRICKKNLMDLARPKSFSLTASLSSRCWLPSSCWLSTSSIAPRAAFRGQAQSTVGEKNKGRKKSRIWWRRWTETRAEAGVAALWKNTSAGEGPMVQLRRSVKIHTTYKPNKLVVKRIHFDEIYATMVSDRSYDQ